MHRVTPKTPLTYRARQLRKDAPVPERVLWGLLRGRRLDGYKFRRQQVLGPYIADYYCEYGRLVIELDGRSHEGRMAADSLRDQYLQGCGIEVLRIPNDELLKNKVGVCESILRILRGRTASPHPDPLPRGEGKTANPHPKGEGSVNV